MFCGHSLSKGPQSDHQVSSHLYTLILSMGPTIWKHLPINVRNIESLPSFKHVLTSHFIGT